jgi:DNA-binding LytR/AlgR family response regulator
MAIQIGICDDKAEDIGILIEALYTYDDSFQILKYEDGESLLKDCFDKKIIFDILFLDIYMPGLNGIETAVKIRASMKYAKIIFVSSSNDYYTEAYEVFAFNYIIKPLNSEQLNGILDQALMRITDEKEQSQHIQFSYKAINYRIFCKDILYIESSDKIIFFHIIDRPIVKCYGKLDEILRQLPEETFIRCHQSYAVNIFHLTDMVENHFCIGELVINISKKYHKVSKDKYFDYIFKYMNCKRY